MLTKLLILPTLAVSTTIAGAASISLTAIEDTYTLQSSATTNFSGESTVSFGAAAGGQARSLLLRFDTSSLASIPAADILSVTLNLTLQDSTGRRGGFVGTLVDANADWTNSGATWNTKDGSNAWILGGARGGSDSEILNPVFTILEDDAFNDTLFSIPLDVTGTSYADFSELFAEWNDGINNGLVIYNVPIPAPLAAGVQTFYSSEATNAAFRPQLVIETIPEPSSALFGLLGLAAFLRRKR